MTNNTELTTEALRDQYRELNANFHDETGSRNSAQFAEDERLLKEFKAAHPEIEAGIHAEQKAIFDANRDPNRPRVSLLANRKARPGADIEL